MRNHRIALVSTLALSLALTLPVVPAEAATATPTSTTTKVVTDSFNRNVASGWGESNRGGTYAVTASEGVTSKVSKGRGIVSNLKSGAHFEATLPTTAVESKGKVAVRAAKGLTKSTKLTTSFRVRGTDSGSYYSITYRSLSGKRSLQISRVVDGASVSLGVKKVKAAAHRSKKLWIEYEITGVSPVKIKARVWRAGKKKPAWQITRKDSAATRLTDPGTFALANSVASAKPVELQYDQLAITSKAGASSTTSRASLAASNSISASVTAAAAAASASTAGRGTTLGSSNFAAPAGAIYVAASNGNDTSGTGSVGAPFRTLAKALTVAGSGATIVLRAGTYHESVTITKSVTVQNYPGEVVWFDGSKVVSSWKKSGNVWVAEGWTALHSRTMGGTAAFRARFVDSENPIAYYPDMLFVNGARQTQVASAAAVTAGTFFVDESAHRLVMGSDPSGKEVRASDLERAIYSWGSKVTLQGFGVRRYATPYELRGAVTNDGANGTFRHLQFVDNATTGINVAGDNQTVENVVADRNGQQGIIGKGPGIRVLNNLVRDNNVERFKPEPVAGGIRIGKASNALVANNQVSGSIRSYGLWFDVNCSDVVIVNNILTDNERLQLEYEISKNAIIANNIATGGQAGIVIFNSENVKVFNNVVGGQSTFGMNILQDERWQTQGTTAFPLRSRNIVYSNNVYGCGQYFQIYALDGYTGIPVDQMNVTITGNLFSKRLTTTGPTMVAWGKGDKKTLERYETPSALAAAKGSTWKNAQTPGCSPLADMTADIAGAQGVAAPLPADVASALGVATGYKKVGLISK